MDHQQSSTEYWQKQWSQQADSGDAVLAKHLERIQHLPMWKTIKAIVEREFGSFEGIACVELGCGAGTASALLGIWGARITLVDYSDAALEVAQNRMTKLGLDATYVQADILTPPNHLLNAFDLCMSFGTAEHFGGSLREEVFKAHYNVLRSGGLGIIQVPNALHLPYRINFMIRSLIGKIVDYELPLTPIELKKRMMEVGFDILQLTGSQMIKDTIYFLFWDLVLNAVLKLCRIPSRQLILSKHVSIPHIQTPLDRWFGYGLIAIGQA
ncbi:class I SAM-dependent methyltransferase [Candidatus Poribacteria bacterium]|nr:class I SAM-dependent methyltransferase [Candidatus Poribacteria bacterium]